MHNELNSPEYQHIGLCEMKDNPNGGIPVYMRRYAASGQGQLHRHDSIQINYITKGFGFHEINGGRYELVKGDIYIIPPYIPHMMFTEEKGNLEIIELEFLQEFVMPQMNMLDEVQNNPSFFDFSYIEPFLVMEHRVKPRLNLTGTGLHKVESILKEMEGEYLAREDGYLLALRALLLKLLVELGRNFRKATEDNDTTHIYDRHREAISLAINYMQENLAEPMAVEKLAKTAMLSPSYFSYLFKSVTNYTPLEYLISLRIKKAMELLKDTNAMVVEVCMETGFQNVSHFNRTFKNVVGVSPTQYRKSSRAEKNKQ